MHVYSELQSEKEREQTRKTIYMFMYYTNKVHVHVKSTTASVAKRQVHKQPKKDISNNFSGLEISSNLNGLEKCTWHTGNYSVGFTVWVVMYTCMQGKPVEHCKGLCSTHVQMLDITHTCTYMYMYMCMSNIRMYMYMCVYTCTNILCC